MEGVRGGKGRTCSDTVQYNQSDTWQLTLTNQTASGDGTEYQYYGGGGGNMHVFDYLY